MLEINITSNIEEAIKHTSDFFRSQVPYGTSIALNNTIKDVRRVIIGPTWNKAFTVRNKTFPRVVFRMKFSKKSDLEVMLFDSLGREYLETHATGGTKYPTGGSRLAIPINSVRTQSGRIYKSKLPRRLRSKKSTRIVRGKTGKDLIVERFKGEMIPRYVLAHQAKIKKTFRFYEDAENIFNRVINGHWNYGMDRAISTSKFFSKK